jgi:hypothetical protein
VCAKPLRDERERPAAEAEWRAARPQSPPPRKPTMHTRMSGSATRNKIPRLIGPIRLAGTEQTPPHSEPPVRRGGFLRLERKGVVMTDPRFTDPDPRSSDSRFDDPYLRHGESLGGAWFWVPALGFVLLIGALILANNLPGVPARPRLARIRSQSGRGCRHPRQPTWRPDRGRMLRRTSCNFRSADRGD